jgi:hypothetical protein
MYKLLQHRLIIWIECLIRRLDLLYLHRFLLLC